MRLSEKEFRRLQAKVASRKSVPRRVAAAPRRAAIEWRESGFALSIPLHVVSEMNQREHWARRHRRNKAQQAEVAAEWRALVGPRAIPLPCRVHFTQLGFGLPDSDNSTIAFKHVRDAVAALLGVDDGSDVITWTYAREAAREHSIRLEVTFIDNKE